MDALDPLKISGATFLLGHGDPEAEKDAGIGGWVLRECSSVGDQGSAIALMSLGNEDEIGLSAEPGHEVNAQFRNDDHIVGGKIATMRDGEVIIKDVVHLQVGEGGAEGFVGIGGVEVAAPQGVFEKFVEVVLVVVRVRVAHQKGGV